MTEFVCFYNAVPAPSKEYLLGHVEDENHFIWTAPNLLLETIDLQSWETM